MVKYNKDFKKQVLLLPDEIGVKKAAEQLGINYYTIADWRKLKSEGRENRIGQNAVERAGTCYAARNTGAEKSEV